MEKIFRRQIELKGWDQSIISQQTCLLLGVGGIGCTIAMDLCRMGVKKIIMVDHDTVEEHNLNRQILFKREHIGQYKVNCALEELQRQHNPGTKRRSSDRSYVPKVELEGYFFDALLEWNRIIELVKECTCIFNTIDYGDYFDWFICKLAAKYSKPLVLGGTEPFYGHTVSYFLQKDAENKYYWDFHDLKPIPEMKEDVESFEFLTQLPQDSHPEKGGSTVYSAGTGAHLMTSAMINYLHHLKDPERPSPPAQMIFNLMTMESYFWDNVL